jgi:hypothetical protein
MSRSLRIALVLAALVVAAPGARAAGLPSLYVDYREDCTFRVTDDAGAAVTQVAPTTYQVVVATPAPFAGIFHAGANDLVGCNGSVGFRLTGPGVNVTTTLDGGDGAYEVFGVTFQPGASYALQDDSNVSGTRRTIVASAPVPTAPSTTPTTGAATKAPAKKAAPIGPKVVGTLAGSVTTTGRLALTLKGKPVTTLPSGRYRLTVLDEIGRAAFVLQRLGKTATTVTTSAYLGRRTVTLVLGPGQWSFFSTPGRKRYFLVTP